jgi:hypothetical protein
MAKVLLLGLLGSVALAAPLDLSLSLAPLVENQNAIQGRYMITFKDGHQLDQHEGFLGRVLGASMHRHWDEVSNSDMLSDKRVCLTLCRR